MPLGIAAGGDQATSPAHLSKVLVTPRRSSASCPRSPAPRAPLRLPCPHLVSRRPRPENVPSLFPPVGLVLRLRLPLQVSLRCRFQPVEWFPVVHRLASCDGKAHGPFLGWESLLEAPRHTALQSQAAGEAAVPAAVPAVWRWLVGSWLVLPRWGHSYTCQPHAPPPGSWAFSCACFGCLGRSQPFPGTHSLASFCRVFWVKHPFQWLSLSPRSRACSWGVYLDHGVDCRCWSLGWLCRSLIFPACSY